jgi:hypothetical protein
MCIQKYYFCTEKANNVLYCKKLGYYFRFGKFKYVLFSSNIPYTIWSEVVCGTPEAMSKDKDVKIQVKVTVRKEKIDKVSHHLSF